MLTWQERRVYGLSLGQGIGNKFLSGRVRAVFSVKIWSIMTIISSLFHKLAALKYNLLALGYVSLHFVFIALLGRLFGASSESDVYFLALTIVAYLGHLVQAVWEAWTPWYVERLKQDRREADKLYSLLMVWISAVSLVIIGVYALVRQNRWLPRTGSDSQQRR